MQRLRLRELCCRVVILGPRRLRLTWAGEVVKYGWWGSEVKGCSPHSSGDLHVAVKSCCSEADGGWPAQEVPSCMYTPLPGGASLYTCGMHGAISFIPAHLEMGWGHHLPGAGM